MRNDSPDLPPDIQRLLDAERAAPPPLDSAARIEAGIARRLREDPEGPGGLPLRLRLRALLALLPGWAVPVLAFGLGASVGVGARTVLNPPAGTDATREGPRLEPPPVPPIPSAPLFPSPQVLPPPSAPTAAPPSAAQRTGTGVTVRAVPAGTSSRTAFEDTLDRERALIERARTALYRGSDETALRYLDQCERAFPHGQLAEEREALWIQSAFGAAKYDAARERGRAFARQYPHSLMLPAIEEVLRGASD
jgi:hypothetical protein